MATYESNPGHLAGIWRSQDDIIMYIGNQMVQIWEHCGFPNGHICACRPYMDRMESKPQRYVLVVRTPHDRAKDIDWDKAEWTVNVVGKPQLKIKAAQIIEHFLLGKHAGWDITFYVDVLDIVKPEGKRPESVAIDEDAIMPFSVREEIAKAADQKLKRALNSVYGYMTAIRYGGYMEYMLNLSWAKSDREFKYLDTDYTYKIGGNTMNNHEIETAIRDGGYTDYQRNIIKGFLLRNGLLSNTNLEEVRNIRRDLIPSPKDENKNDTYKIGEDTMNIKYMIQNMIQFNRCGGFTETELESTLKSLLVHYECEREEYVKYYKKLTPTKVIYNGPATIIFFEDGSKTIVKLQEGEQMDREKAVYAAICKHALSTNAHESNWLDMLKPLMKEADEAWRVKSEANALNDDIKKY